MAGTTSSVEAGRSALMLDVRLAQRKGRTRAHNRTGHVSRCYLRRNMMKSLRQRSRVRQFAGGAPTQRSLWVGAAARAAATFKQRVPMLSDSEIDQLSRALLPATLQAGAAIMRHFKSGVHVQHKSDNSPVTLADQQAEDIILEALAETATGVPVVAEEAASRGEAPRDCPDLTGEFILVDPLDGTRGFIKGRNEFTVNIGFVSDGLPVLGLVYAPALGTLYASRTGRSAIRLEIADPAHPASDMDYEGATPLSLRTRGDGGLIAVSSRYQSKRLDAALAKLEASQVNANSSIKFCMVAQGDAHFYPRLGEISEWDTAAGAGVLGSAGGAMTGLDGNPLTYGKVSANYRNAPFVAWGQPEPDPRILSVLLAAESSR